MKFKEFDYGRPKRPVKKRDHFLPFFFFPFVAFFLGKGLGIRPVSGVGYFRLSG